MIRRLNLAVEFWGYASIPVDFCYQHKIDIQAHANNQGWFLVPGKNGSMMHTIKKLPPDKETAYQDIINLPVGETKKALKAKVKEIRKQAKLTKSLPAKLSFK